MTSKKAISSLSWKDSNDIHVYVCTFKFLLMQNRKHVRAYMHCQVTRITIDTQKLVSVDKNHDQASWSTFTCARYSYHQRYWCCDCSKSIYCILVRNQFYAETSRRSSNIDNFIYSIRSCVLGIAYKYFNIY